MMPPSLMRLKAGVPLDVQRAAAQVKSSFLSLQYCDAKLSKRDPTQSVPLTIGRPANLAYCVLR